MLMSESQRDNVGRLTNLNVNYIFMKYIIGILTFTF